MDATDQANAAVDLLSPLVAAVAPDEWGNATPCAEWTVRDLVNHIVGGGHMFAAGLRGEAAPGDPAADPTAPQPDLVGDDPRAAYDAAIVEFRAALAGVDSLEAPVPLPIGTVPAEVALRIAAADLLVHGWDIAQATHRPFSPPDDLVVEVTDFYLVAIGAELRDGDVFAAPVEVDAAAPPLDRLVAFAGRRP